MGTILLPIKPEYVEKIINQTKLYEYRKKQCKRKINKILIYSTAPVKKIVGEVEVKEILSLDPIALWEETKEYSGITYDKYMDYYHGVDIAIAYKLGKVKVYDKPKDLVEIGINYYPQSYVYLD